MTINPQKASIMVIDDTPANLALLEDILSKKGFEVRPITKGKTALKAAKNHPPDLILLDIMMPEMDGFEVCKQLKANDQLKDIPVIFISARSETLDKVQAFKSGAVDYVTKPFQYEEVVARVETHIDLRQTEIELQNKNLELKQTIDDLKATQKQLIQSEKLASLGVLIAGVAHEINNPVNFINASSLGLKKKLAPIVTFLKKLDGNRDINSIIDQKEALNLPALLIAIDDLTGNISTGIERTVEIIKGLQSFSQSDQDDKKSANIHELLDSNLVLLRNQYKDFILIEKDYGTIPDFRCYPGKLNQVFMNVLKNAIDAIKSKKSSNQQEKIHIQTSILETESDRQIRLEISDTGIGVSDDTLGCVFDPFYTTKEVGQGTGLGMSISLGIIESHNGKIEIRNNRNMGATVSITLPLA